LQKTKGVHYARKAIGWLKANCRRDDLNEFGGVIGKSGWKFLAIGDTLYITHLC